MRLSVTLDEADYAELSQLAASLDLSAAWMIRRAISEFIARYRASPESSLPLKASEGSLTDGRKRNAG
ncbi:MAG: CopG family transcriptional regulator [Gammaproteobacteria bacterium]|nr:CopG family transcriptional regulator [Gammaproteobacteria bacterium]